MKDLYLFLDVPSDATFEKIRYAYDGKITNSNFGVSDYENMHDFINAKRAYQVLSVKAFRFLYDIKAGIPENRRLKFDLDSEDLKKVEDAIVKFRNQNESVILELRKQNGEHTAKIQKFESIMKDRDDEYINLSKLLEKEKERTNGMEDAISDMLFKIKDKDGNIALSENRFNLLNREIELLQKHKSALLGKLRDSRNYTFRVVSCVAAFFLFIIFMVFLN